MEKLSFTMENYLEAIFELSNEESAYGARLTDIADRLSVTKSTANSAMSSLAEKGLVKNGRYQHIVLTEEGRKLASTVARKHKTIQLFFIKYLKLNEDTADSDACAIEHVISEEAIEAMRRCLAEERA
ncbi:MAG: metal-dependent transcriptional regulator [Clostridiales bacterium]|jgi:Mn-dependent DtxR family transcriptional regulator|nr:metal-dependent transcriptional regulator [Clostridiales bacterium]